MRPHQEPLPEEAIDAFLLAAFEMSQAEPSPTPALPEHIEALLTEEERRVLPQVEADLWGEDLPGQVLEVPEDDRRHEPTSLVQGKQPENTATDDLVAALLGQGGFGEVWTAPVHARAAGESGTSALVIKFAVAGGPTALDDHLRLVAAYLAAADEQRQADGRDLLARILVAADPAARDRALTFLPQRFWERLLRLARGIAARRAVPHAGADDLDDLAQTMLFEFLRAVKRGRFKGGSLDAFFCTIARHTAADFLRARQLRREVHLAKADLLAAIPDPDRQAERAEARDAICWALDRLESHEREAVSLFLLEGLPLRTAAFELGQSAAAVRCRVARALKKLRKLLSSAAP
jgi:RNA polymerase sigma factor (sigma-70 family)